MIRRWTERVAAGSSESGTAGTVLGDHLDEVLGELRHTLERDVTPPAKRTEGLRYRAGFSLEALVREVGVLRALLLDAIEEAGGALTIRETRRLDGFFERLLAEGVRAHDQRQAQEKAAAQAAVETERRKLHALFAVTPLPIAILEGADHRFAFANPAYRSLVGGREVEGRTLFEALPEIRGQGFDLLLDRVMQTGEPFVGDEVLTRVDRTNSGTIEEVFLTFTYTARRDLHGQIDGVLVSAMDVTTLVLARRQSEQLAERLREAEEVQHRILEASGAGLWELDLATGTLEADARLVELMGRPPGTALRLASALDAEVAPEDRARVEATVAAAMAGENEGRYLTEFRIGGRDGLPRRWVESRARVSFDAAGKARKMGGAMIDITARKQAEEALRTSEDRYRTLFESIDEGYCLIQLLVDEQDHVVDYLFLEANSAFEAQTGLTAPVGKTIRQLAPTISTSWFEIYGRVAATGETVRFENHDPALHRWFDAYANRVGPAERRQVAIVFKDITQRKQVEQERERLLALETEARQQAEEASRMKDNFIATVSHELRTPLSAILGWVHLMRRGTLPADRRERALETVERNARAQAQLIEDLLDMSRILSGKMRLEVEPVDVARVVEAAIGTVQPTADAKGVRLRSVLDSGARIAGDGSRLQQVVWNLLSNAVKFTPRGGHVQVAVRCHESSVEILVSDSGRGMSEEFLPHVFERFRQADMGVTRAQGGLGLGLSIVKQLVELHGGTVRAESEGTDRGSTFTVKLPMSVVRAVSAAGSPGSPDSPGVPAPSTPPVLHDLTGLRVLVVDDEQDSRETVSLLLQPQGVQTWQTASVAEARQLFDAVRPDLVISDIGMPGESGYALLEWIRARPSEHGGQVPAIALTAYARSEDRTRALTAGFSSHLSKPVEPDELLAVIGALVRHGRRPGP